MNPEDPSKVAAAAIAVTAVVGLALAGPKHVEPEPVKAVDVQAQEPPPVHTERPFSDADLWTHTTVAETTTTTQLRRVRRTPTTRPAGRVHAAAPVAEGLLERIGQCESGGSYTAQNRHSTASGKFQALDSSWDGFAGFRRAKDAPPEVQEEWARQAFAASGTRPWLASRRCWG